MRNFSQCLSIMTSSRKLNTAPCSVETAIRQQLKNLQIIAVSSTPIYGLYSITTNDKHFYCDASGRYLLFGEFCTLESLSKLSKPPFRPFKRLTTQQDNIQ